MSLDSFGLPPVPPSKPAQVFISHSHQDKVVVDWLVDQVEAVGHKAWVASRDLPPGSNQTEEIRRALAESDAYILLLTEQGYDSEYVKHEVGAAVVSNKPVIALVDHAVADRNLGMLADIVQVRIDRDNLAESAAQITKGLVAVGKQRGVPVQPQPIHVPNQTAVLSVAFEMNVQFQISADQVLLGIFALVAIGALFYIATNEGSG